MLSCAIYLFIVIKSDHVFSVFFLLIGIILLLLSLCSFQLRKAPGCLLCFLLIDLCIFAVTLIMSLVLLLNQSKVETWARDQYDEYKSKHPDDFKNIDEYVDFLLGAMQDVSYAMLVFTGMIFMQLFCGYCYRESTINKTDERREKLEESMQKERTEKLV